MWNDPFGVRAPLLVPSLLLYLNSDPRHSQLPIPSGSLGRFIQDTQLLKYPRCHPGHYAGDTYGKGFILGWIV